MPEPTSEDPVFVSRYGKPWKSWRTAFNNAVERAGLKDCTFHTLRHTFAMRLYQKTRDVLLVKEALRHRSIASTLVYCRIQERQLRKALCV